jgi:hypothetical protein
MLPSKQSLWSQNDDDKIGKIDDREFKMGAKKIPTGQMTDHWE